MGLDNVRVGLEKGFLDYEVEADDNYVPRLLLNKNSTDVKSKVGNVIKEELENCIEFSFSVAFITVSGVAWLHDTLKKLESKNILWEMYYHIILLALLEKRLFLMMQVQLYR